MADVFISHSSLDAGAATSLSAWLASQGFPEIYLDCDPAKGMAPGEEWRKVLQRELRTAKVVVLLVSESWLTSTWCVSEYRTAELLGKRILPLLIGSVDRDRAVEMLGHYQFVDFRRDELQARERLLVGLAESGLIRGRFRYEGARPPYPGLAAFDEADAAVFFGREAEVVKALDRIRVMRSYNQPKFLIILGSSGVGKSSLMRAGILPRLRRKEAGPFCIIGPMFPHSPMVELKLALMRGLPHPSPSPPTATAPSDAVESAKWIDDVNSALAGARDDNARPLFAIDQLEQLLLAAPEERQKFLGFLSSALGTEHSWLGIATIRVDYFAAFQAELAALHKEFSSLPKKRAPPAIDYELLSLDQIAVHRLHDVIESPATAAGRRLTPDLVDRLVRDTGTGDALALLAFALRRLDETIPADRAWTVADYESLGEGARDLNPIEGCIRRQANEAAFGTRSEHELDPNLRHALVPLMTEIGENGQPIRHTVRRDALPPLALPAIDRLIDARLCLAGTDPAGAATVTITHEALYRVWPPLQAAVDAAREKLSELRSGERSAREWEAHERQAAWLDHRGLRLRRLRRIMRDPAYSARVSDRVRRYLVACRRKASATVLRWSAVAAAAGLIAAFAAAFSIQLHDSENLLGAAEEAIGAGDPFRAGALAFAALPPPGSLVWVDEQRALRLLSQSGLAFARGRYGAATKGLESAAISPDGAQVVTADDAGKVLIFDLATGEILKTIDASAAPVLVVRFSPDGKRIATGDSAGAVRVYDAKGWTRQASASVHARAIADMAFDREGSTLVTAAADGSGRLLEFPSLRPTGELAGASGHQMAVACVVFDSARSLVVTGSHDETVKLWTLPPRVVDTIKVADAWIHACALEATGSVLAVGTDKGQIATVNLETREVRTALSLGDDPVWAVAFSPHGDLIASGWNDGALRLSRAAGTAEPRAVAFHRQAVRSLAFDLDGRLVLTASLDGTAMLWDVTALLDQRVPTRETAASALCRSALARQLTLWRPTADRPARYEPTSECACDRSGILSSAYWRGLARTMLAGERATDGKCSFPPVRPLQPD